MYFRIISKITGVSTIASGGKIRELRRLTRV